MAEIITAVYGSHGQVTNAVDDLRSTGIPNEKIRVSEEKLQVQVFLPDVAAPEIREILERHQPTEIGVRDVAD